MVEGIIAIVTLDIYMGLKVSNRHKHFINLICMYIHVLQNGKIMVISVSHRSVRSISMAFSSRFQENNGLSFLSVIRK